MDERSSKVAWGYSSNILTGDNGLHHIPSDQPVTFFLGDNRRNKIQCRLTDDGVLELYGSGCGGEALVVWPRSSNVLTVTTEAAMLAEREKEADDELS